MSLIVIPFLLACFLALFIYLIFRMFAQHFGTDTSKVDADLRKELEGTRWIMEDGSNVVFHDVVGGGSHFIVRKSNGKLAKALAETLFRAEGDDDPVIKEIA